MQLRMHHLADKILAYVYDTLALATIFLGFISGTDIAVVLGMAASVMAFINHFTQWRDRRKAKRIEDELKKKQTP